MRILCVNGFYKFFPQSVAELRRFTFQYGLDLVQKDDYYTFDVLASLPNFSFIGQPYSGLNLGLVNYAGKPEDVLKENGYTFFQASQSLVLKQTLFLNRMDYTFTNYILMDKLPQAYYYDSNGIINGFSGFCDVDFMIFKIDRFFYESI